METNFMDSAAKIIAEVRTLTGIDEVHAEALEELLKDAICSARNIAYDAGRVDGYADGYEEGYAESYDVGFDAGYEVGHFEGYDVGLEDGYALQWHTNGSMKIALDNTD